MTSQGCWNDDDEEDYDGEECEVVEVEDGDEDDEFDRYCGGCGFSPEKNEETIFWIVMSLQYKLRNIVLEKRNAEPGILNRFSECEVLEREGYTKERIKEMLADDIFAEILSDVETYIEYLPPIDPAKIFLLVDFIMVQPGLLRLIGFGMFFRKRIERHLLSLV